MTVLVINDLDLYLQGYPGLVVICDILSLEPEIICILISYSQYMNTLPSTRSLLKIGDLENDFQGQIALYHFMACGI